MTVHGKEVDIYKEVDSVYYLVGCAYSCTFNFLNEIIGKTDANAGLFRKRRVRISDCSGSINGVVKLNNENSLGVFHFLEEGVRRSEGNYKFRFTDDDTGEVKTITMTAIIERIGIVSDKESLSEFDIGILGSGTPEIDESDPPTVLCDEWDSDWWSTTPGATTLSGLSQDGKSFAGKTILFIGRDGDGLDIIDTGTPGDGQAKYTGATTIEFDGDVPFESSETVFIIWVQ